MNDITRATIERTNAMIDKIIPVFVVLLSVAFVFVSVVFSAISFAL